MKKILLSAAACFALASCGISDIDNDAAAALGSTFEKGQKVVLTARGGEVTKAFGNVNTEAGGVDFKFETGDRIKVTVGSSSAEFTLIGEGGSNTGQFEGVMPEDGDSFDVQYPYEAPSPSAFADQTYSPDYVIPSGMMLASATGCSGTSFNLTPRYAALKLNFYGLDRTVSRIVLTNISSESDPQPSYTLTCPSPVKVSTTKSSPTPFFIVLPVVDSAWRFRAEVTVNEVSPAVDNTVHYIDNGDHGLGTVLPYSTTFETSNAISFESGVVVSMKARPLTVDWAPVNCGYAQPGALRGKYYQWGRKYGQAYELGNLTPEPLTKESGQLEANAGKFGENNSLNNNWFPGDQDNTLWNGEDKGMYDPCPPGWRVPSISEFKSLLNNTSSSTETSTWTSPGDKTVGGRTFYGNTAKTGPSVFLPVTGDRQRDSGEVYARDAYGKYWSSDISHYFYFSSSGAGTSINSLSYGYSVRCVLD